ncbi:helix-turn-helix domain-containing protein [Nocardia terpenica]|nr:helix-turn-helix domain-containing protein [Nocardia terpenica]NQE88638.1 helix-turn-helix domain-containing protein [Nocardia terpenica]NQE88649.1 helix-turn-helix domain-containing protein [Nocardia terpenica]
MTTPMSPAQAAQAAGCHQNSIYAALLAGELKGYQRTAPKGRWRIFPEDLTRWIKGE